MDWVRPILLSMTPIEEELEANVKPLKVVDESAKLDEVMESHRGVCKISGVPPRPVGKNIGFSVMAY